jgi:hypothetical protein
MKINKINFAVLKPKYVYNFLIKEIKLILFISLVSSSIFFFLSVNKKAYTFNVYIKNLKNVNLEYPWSYNKNFEYEKIFNEEFASTKNLIEFINKRNNFSKKSFTLESYKIKEKDIDGRYYATFFHFDELSDIEIYFKDYMKFISNKSFTRFQKYLIQYLNGLINEYEYALKIAHVIKLDKPNLLFVDGKIVFSYNQELFYKGSDVLKTEIIQFKEKIQIIKNLKEFEAEYELSAKNIENFKFNITKFILNILLLSLFFSAVIIYLKYKFFYSINKEL